MKDCLAVDCLDVDDLAACAVRRHFFWRKRIFCLVVVVVVLQVHTQGSAELYGYMERVVVDLLASCLFT